jgi:hypothetical protein
MKRVVRQSGLSGVRVTGRYPSFGQVASTEGVVIAVRYTDDERNRSKKYVEYDVRDLKSGQVYPNCRRLSTTSGQEDGEENVLHAAQKLQDNTSAGFVFDPKTAPLSQSDGDRVVLNFIHGAHHSPVIVGVIQHSRNGRYQTHKGTSVETAQDGTYQVKRGDTTITLNADASVEVRHTSGSYMRFNTDGSIQLVPATTIDIGDSPLTPIVTGVLNGEAIDSLTGLPMWALDNASTVVRVKK